MGKATGINSMPFCNRNNAFAVAYQSHLSLGVHKSLASHLNLVYCILVYIYTRRRAHLNPPKLTGVVLWLPPEGFLRPAECTWPSATSADLKMPVLGWKASLSFPRPQSDTYKRPYKCYFQFPPGNRKFSGGGSAPKGHCEGQGGWEPQQMAMGSCM